ncbi:MAG: 6-carboxytetrahydropterin synthase QueD [Kiritimatiellaeota bacterium]|nr:6-carboxytetrahydropterin synthase QueD [Kiritimatiellota bacterium]
MLTVSKECRFDAAHVLTNHAGHCKNLHGHTYRLIVEVAESAAASDMVMDFKDLKQVLRDVILARFDHAFLYDETSAVECDIAGTIARHDMRRVPLPFRTTAENLARHFFRELAPHVNVLAVHLYETPESCATYRNCRERRASALQ